VVDELYPTGGAAHPPGADEDRGSHAGVEAAHAMEASGSGAPDVVGEDPEVVDVLEPPVTGDPVVDEAVRLVAKAVGGPLEDQVSVYEAVHRGVQDRLADVEN
jgi:hypothetical protein